jgi:iron complex transport system ATP-binding protein
MTSLLEAREIGLKARLCSTNLTCRSGEMVAVIGPNGAGKTSLLRALAWIESDTGQVFVEGELLEDSPPTRRMRLLSFLPATRSLIWPIAAQDVIALGLPATDGARIDDLIEMLELQNLSARPVNHLSTGERSRVLLARSLAAKPRLLLLDEPLSNLDPYWVIRTLQILRGAADSTGCAILASVHDLAQVEAFDRVLLVEGGRIAADGAPMDILESPVLSSALGIKKSGSAWRIAGRD